MSKINTPINLVVHSFRKRSCDIDGISAKAAIDGFIHQGILADDSPKEVKKILFSQELAERGEDERTIFTFIEA